MSDFSSSRDHAPPASVALEALRQIAALEPATFVYPPDHGEQIASCPECKRYEGHPVQRGICDTHRRPFWDREKHDDREERRLGWTAKGIARDALSSLSSAEQVEREGSRDEPSPPEHERSKLSGGWEPIETARGRELEVVLVGYENIGSDGDHAGAVAHLCELLRTALRPPPPRKETAAEEIGRLQREIGTRQQRLHWLVLGDPTKGVSGQIITAHAIGSHLPSLPQDHAPVRGREGSDDLQTASSTQCADAQARPTRGES